MAWRRIDVHRAAERGDVAVLERYLKAGGDAERKDSEYGAAPVHWASLRGKLSAVSLLLDHGADLEGRTGTDGTPLVWGCMGGDPKVVEHLLGRGADISAVTKGKGTALHHAATYGHPEAVTMLLERGAGAHAEDNRGQRPGDKFDPEVSGSVKRTIANTLAKARGETRARSSSSKRSSRRTGGGSGKTHRSSVAGSADSSSQAPRLQRQQHHDADSNNNSKLSGSGANGVDRDGSRVGGDGGGTEDEHETKTSERFGNLFRPGGQQQQQQRQQQSLACYKDDDEESLSATAAAEAAATLHPREASESPSLPGTERSDCSAGSRGGPGGTTTSAPSLQRRNNVVSANDDLSVASTAAGAATSQYQPRGRAGTVGGAGGTMVRGAAASWTAQGCCANGTDSDGTYASPMLYHRKNGVMVAVLSEAKSSSSTRISRNAGVAATSSSSSSVAIGAAAGEPSSSAAQEDLELDNLRRQLEGLAAAASSAAARDVEGRAAARLAAQAALEAEVRAEEAVRAERARSEKLEILVQVLEDRLSARDIEVARLGENLRDRDAHLRHAENETSTLRTRVEELNSGMAVLRECLDNLPQTTVPPDLLGGEINASESVPYGRSHSSPSLPFQNSALRPTEQQQTRDLSKDPTSDSTPRNNSSNNTNAHTPGGVVVGVGGGSSRGVLAEATARRVLGDRRSTVGPGMLATFAATAAGGLGLLELEYNTIAAVKQREDGGNKSDAAGGSSVECSTGGIEKGGYRGAAGEKGVGSSSSSSSIRRGRPGASDGVSRNAEAGRGRGNVGGGLAGVVEWWRRGEWREDSPRNSNPDNSGAGGGGEAAVSSNKKKQQQQPDPAEDHERLSNLYSMIARR